ARLLTGRFVVRIHVGEPTPQTVGPSDTTSSTRLLSSPSCWHRFMDAGLMRLTLPYGETYMTEAGDG
ncbi:MAG: hypothetical protein WD942_10695, partial [Dehalococcoidia bacterium]